MKKYQYIDNNDFYYLLSTMKATVANTLATCNPYYLWELFEVSGEQVRLIDYMYNEEEPTKIEKEFYIRYTSFKDENDNWINWQNRKTRTFFGNDLELLMQELDFEYNAGYGSQEIEGFISFTDDTWLEREEYDGSEWWDFKQCPKLEDFIKE